MTMIRGRLKEAQDQKKSYVDTHWVDRSYEVGDRVLLRVRPQKISIRFGKGEKIISTVCGTFRNIRKERVSDI